MPGRRSLDIESLWDGTMLRATDPVSVNRAHAYEANLILPCRCPLIRSPKKHFAARRILQKLHLYGVPLSHLFTHVRRISMNKNRLHCAQPAPVSIIGQARHRTLIKLGIAGKRTHAGKIIEGHTQPENKIKILSTFVKQRTYPRHGRK